MSYLAAILLERYYECVLNFQMLSDAEYKAIARELRVSTRSLREAMFEAVLLDNEVNS